MPVVLPEGKQSFTTAAGLPGVGYRLYTYQPGTSTPKQTFTDYTGGTPNANPVVANARGEMAVYWDGVYDVVLRDASDNLIWGPERLETPDAAGSAAQLEADLANAVSAALGSSLVGHLDSLSYASGTVGGALRRFNPIRKYGVINNDGTTDDATTFQAAAASGDKFIDARGVNCRIASAVSIPDGQVWLLHGATLTMASATQTMWDADAVDDWALLGPFRITGDGSSIGTAKAIRVSDCSRWLVDSPNISNIKGWGFYLEPGSSTTARATHGTLRTPIIHTCYYGYEDVAGTGAEYCTIENPRIYGCVVHGLKTCAGNTIVLGGHIVDNTALGVHLAAGSNSAHGIFSGVNINHNGTFGVHAEQVLNGFTFDGCHIYENDLWFDRSKGIHILGGVLDANLYNYSDGSSGMNVIDGCFCPGDYGIARVIGSDDGHDQLILRNLWGAGSYAAAGGKDTAGVTINDPALVYVQAQRDTNATQALSSGVATTLTFSAIGYLFDRRGMLNAGTGAFTVPAGHAGLYRFCADLLFSGASITAGSCFVEVKVGASSKKVLFVKPYSSTKAQADGTFDLYLNAGDVVTFVGTIVGSSPEFGDNGWPSNVSIERIA